MFEDIRPANKTNRGFSSILVPFQGMTFFYAPCCLQAKHELLHRDHDFDCFEKVLGLRVEHV